MAVANAFGKVVTSGSMFMYDTGDTVNSYIGEPTTNIFRHYGTTGQGSATDNSVSFEVNGDGTFIRLGYGQTFGGYTIQPNDVVYKYNLGSYGCHYHGNDVSIPSGRYVTFTFDYYISPGAGGYPETNYLANMETGTGAGMSVGAPNNLTGVWQTISVPAGPSTSAGNLRMLLYPGACGGRLASSGYILFKNPQVELLPHKTPFTQTSRSVTGSLLPLIGNSTLNLSTVSFNSNAQITFDGTDDYINPDFTSGPNGTVELIIKSSNYANTIPISINGDGYASGPNIYFGSSYILWNTGDGASNPFTNASYPNSNYHHLVVTNTGISGGVATLYIDGILIGTANGLNMTTTGANKLWIGRYHDGSYNFNGEMPIVKIYNRVLSISEVKQNYNKYKTRFNLA
jgi:hypothetical protein